MIIRNDGRSGSAGMSRRALLKTGAGLAGSTMLPMTFPARAFAADQPPIGTWPAGSKATPSMSALPFRAPALMRCRARTSSRVSSSRSSTSTAAIR